MWFLLAAMAACAIAADYKTYDGYQVLTMSPQSADEILLINELPKELGYDLDFFRRSHMVGFRSDVIVPPQGLYKAKQFLMERGVDYNVTIPNLRIPIERQRRQLGSRRPLQRPSAFTFDVLNYHTFQEQMQYVVSVGAVNPTIARAFTMGRSSQGRQILGIVLSDRRITTPKPIIFIDGGIHAREWVSPAVALWIIKELTKPTYATLLRQVEFVIVPNANPDGYEYSRTKDRLWRKTRSGPRRGCYGVDANRNFPYQYAFQGSSYNPCSDIYHGTGPLSEPECRSLRNLLVAKRSQTKAYITLHSYGENILYPWGYRTRTYPQDVNDLITMGRAISSAIQRVYGTRYTVANAADSLYAAAGASDDYAKSIGIKYVYTFELRPGEGDRDQNIGFGFELPANFIQRTAEEVWQGMLVLARRVAASGVSPAQRRQG